MRNKQRTTDLVEALNVRLAAGTASVFLLCSYPVFASKALHSTPFVLNLRSKILGNWQEKEMSKIKANTFCVKTTKYTFIVLTYCIYSVHNR